MSRTTLYQQNRRHVGARVTLASLIAFALATASSHTAAQEHNGQFPHRASPASDRLIVKWKSGTQLSSGQQKIDRLATRARAKMNDTQSLAPQMQVVQLERRLSLRELTAVAASMEADPDIEFAVPDYRRYPHALPNDSLISAQWYLLSTEVAALRAESAWDITTGSAGTIVAVLDTGVRFDHPDLLPASEGGKLLPGYDFVSGESTSSFVGANDGDGRDPDPSDPGDWVDDADIAKIGFEECEVANSSWHGTRVAGVIAAQTNNGIGMAGAAWNAWILPVRVMGKCGGRDSDIIAAMRWAAGLSVPGVPDNPYPAKIINLSLGSEGTCTAAYQSVVSELAARGVLIVASAGNEGGPANAPANCGGVLGVAGVRQIGTKVGFSNLGSGVSIAAPGGNCVTIGGGQPCLFSIVTATNLGDRAPASSGYTDEFNFNVGTSFSAPMVAGTAALMHAVNGRLGSEHLIQRLRASATPFPENPNTEVPNCRVPAGPDDIQAIECYCTTETCGAGLLNANGAVVHAQRPIASVQVPSIVSPGQTLTLDASQSSAACDRTIAAYEWSVVSSSGATPQLGGLDQSVTTVQVPAVGEFTLRVVVTDNVGSQDSAEVAVSSVDISTTASLPSQSSACPTPVSVAHTTAPPATQAPQPATSANSPSRGGGGGQFGWELLALALFLRVRRDLTCPR